MQPRQPWRADALLDDTVELLESCGGRGTLRVRGPSMEPTLCGGQRFAVAFSPGRPRRGDVIVFRRGGQLTVHRMLGWSAFGDGRPGLRTRGDGVPRLDPRVEPGAVIARLIAIERHDGWRDARARRAQAYGLGVALHDFLWAALYVLAERAERRVERLGWRLGLAGVVAAADRWVLGLAHRALFAICHPRIGPP